MPRFRFNLQAVLDARQRAEDARRLESAQGRLREASRDRRAIELVRESRFDEWRDAIERREQAALDEIATIQGGRDRRTEEEVVSDDHEENH